MSHRLKRFGTVLAIVVGATIAPDTAKAGSSTAVAPVNDAFTAAAEIQGGQTRLASSNAGATKETGEPAHAGNAGGASVWYRWTAPRDGHFTFTTAGSEFDTLLAVYTGPALDALAQLAADDDSGPGPASELSFGAVAGTVYHVAVDGFHGKVGRLRLAWRSAPPNDNFADAQAIANTTGRIDSPGAGATKEAGEPGHAEDSEANRSVWFRWTAPTTERQGFEVREGTGLVAVYAGAGLNALVPVGEGRIPIVDAQAGTTYQIAVEGAGADTVLAWHGPPPNDDFANATTIVGRSGRVRGSNIVASRETDEPRHGKRSRTSVWYRWRAPRTGVAKVATSGSSYDTLLAVYRGSRVEDLRRLAADDDSGPRAASAVRIQVKRGRLYRIAVDGYSGDMGDVVLRWKAWTTAACSKTPRAGTPRSGCRRGPRAGSADRPDR